MKYFIGEFAMLVGLTTHTLRYYEKEQLLRPQRDGGGRRRYTEQDKNWLAFIKKLKETGMPLKDIKEYARLRYEGEATLSERLHILETHRLFVQQENEKWHNNLLNLEEKIQWYQGELATKN